MQVPIRQIPALRRQSGQTALSSTGAGDVRPSALPFTADPPPRAGRCPAGHAVARLIRSSTLRRRRQQEMGPGAFWIPSATSPPTLGCRDQAAPRSCRDDHLAHLSRNGLNRGVKPPPAQSPAWGVTVEIGRDRERLREGLPALPGASAVMTTRIGSSFEGSTPSGSTTGFPGPPEGPAGPRQIPGRADPGPRRDLHPEVWEVRPAMAPWRSGAPARQPAPFGRCHRWAPRHAPSVGCSRPPSRSCLSGSS